MRTGQRATANSTRSGGFTLVELLVVIAIIGILASLFLGGMYTAEESARVQKTKATIAKINNIIMARWDSYRTRRVPITMVTTNTTSMGANAPITAAGWRLDALREIMRLEMPVQWIEVQTPPLTSSQTIAGRQSIVPNGYNLSLASAYQRKYNAMATPPTAAYQSAECLYLICTSGVSDEVDPRDLFKANEIGDYDQDGAPEFIDAWGMPIYFLRWAPGFVSELQTGLDPDPFDPMHIYPSVTGATGQSGYAGFKYQTNPTFALYPLIFSAGPDKQYDIVVPSVMPYSPSIASGAGPPYNVDPFSSLTNASTSNPSDGTPYNASNGGTPLYSFDNIHNHLMGTK